MARLLYHSDLEHVFDDPERAGRVAGRCRALDGPDALVCGVGDDLAPGVLPLVERGRQALPFFEAVGTAFETFGNHDFDFGVDQLLGIVRDSPVTWLCANARLDGELFGADAGVRPHAVREVDGTTVGLFGLAAPGTADINPGADPVTFEDPYEAADEAIAALRRRSADRLVALSHLGAGDDELARRTDLDAVLGGHVHSRRVDRVDGTLLVRPGAGGHAIGEVDLVADEARLHDVAGAPVVDAVTEDLRGRVATAGLDEVVAEAPEPMPRDEETVFGGECRIGNFVADAFRARSGAEVALINSGGIRAGPPLDGDVTRAELVSLVPFEYPLVVAEVPGDRLRAAVAGAVGERMSFGEPHWWHAHLSGATVTYDREAGELVEFRVHGAPVEADRHYEVGLAGFLLRSSQEFPTLEVGDRAGEFDVQYEEVVTYAREHGVRAPLDGRLTLLDGGGPPVAPTLGGDERA